MNAEAIRIAELAVRRYAESHPRPPHVTQTQAAEMLGLSRQTVSKMIRCGALRLNRFGLIPVSEIDKAIAADQRGAEQYPRLLGCNK